MYRDLKLADRARIIGLAVKSGITDLRTIENVYNTFAQGGDLEESQPSSKRNYNGRPITLEEYQQLQAQAIREAAVKKALTRTAGVAPIINGEPASSCIYTFTDNYGKKYQVAGTQTFAANPEKYGFEVAGPVTEGMEGNMYMQMNENGVPYHATMITGYADDGKPLLTYSSGHAGGFSEGLPGGPIPRDRWNNPNETYEHYLERYNRSNSPEADYHKNRKVWSSPQYETYRFIGTPEDKARWAEEWSGLEGYPSINNISLAPLDTPLVTIPEAAPSFAKGGPIYIKKANRGKFTALKKRTGHSASWFKAHGTPAQKKMAVFALNARKWKHGDGGLMTKM